MNNIKILLTWH